MNVLIVYFFHSFSFLYSPGEHEAHARTYLPPFILHVTVNFEHLRVQNKFFPTNDGTALGVEREMLQGDVAQGADRVQFGLLKRVARPAENFIYNKKKYLKQCLCSFISLFMYYHRSMC